MHPHVKRIVLDQAMAIGVPSVEVERRTSIEWSTDWPLAPEDRELAQQITRDLDDWNQIVDWYADTFQEPMPALLARLAAACLISLDGAVVRPMFGGFAGGNDEGTYSERMLRVDVGVAPEASLGNLRAHYDHLLRYLYAYRLAPAPEQALVEYLALIQSLGAWYPPQEREPPRRVMRSMVPALALALDSLLERRALRDEARGPSWIPVETLAGLLALPGAHRRVELRLR
jgi:hypothetical protein